MVHRLGKVLTDMASTEKAPGMFGTLVLCLPSEHTGGKVRTKHKHKEAYRDTSEFSAPRCFLRCLVSLGKS